MAHECTLVRPDRRGALPSPSSCGWHWCSGHTGEAGADSGSSVGRLLARSLTRLRSLPEPQPRVRLEFNGSCAKALSVLLPGLGSGGQEVGGLVGGGMVRAGRAEGEDQRGAAGKEGAAQC